MNDAELADIKLKGGDWQRHIFDEYFAYVSTIAAGKLRGAVPEDIDECISDIFADVFRYLADNSTSFSGDLKGIIATIANRRAIDRKRSLSAKKNQFYTVSGEELPEIPSGEDIPTDMEYRQQKSRLLEAVRSLGKPDSDMILLKYYYCRNSSEIGQILGMSPAAVRMRCSRALKKLKDILEKE